MGVVFFLRIDEMEDIKIIIWKIITNESQLKMNHNWEFFGNFWTTYFINLKKAKLYENEMFEEQKAFCIVQASQIVRYFQAIS